MTGRFLDWAICGTSPGLPPSQSAVMPGLHSGTRIGFHPHPPATRKQNVRNLT
jgi:hypothetical protein